MTKNKGRPSGSERKKVGDQVLWKKDGYRVEGGGCNRRGEKLQIRMKLLGGGE